MIFNFFINSVDTVININNSLTTGVLIALGRFHVEHIIDIYNIYTETGFAWSLIQL